MKYTGKILLEYAEMLRQQADNIEIGHTLGGALLGVVLGAGLGYAGGGSDAATGFGFALGALGAAIGYAAAKNRAFWLRIEAEKLLLQMAIEWNTRRPEDREAEKAQKQEQARPRTLFKGLERH